MVGIVRYKEIETRRKIKEKLYVYIYIYSTDEKYMITLIIKLKMNKANLYLLLIKESTSKTYYCRTYS